MEGHDPKALLAGTPLTRDHFTDPNVRIDLPILRRFILNSIECTGDPHLGPKLASRFEAHFGGLPVYAAMNAASLKEALQVLNRFSRLTFPAIEIAFTQAKAGLEPGEAAVRIEPKLALMDLTYFVSSTALIVCNDFLKAITRLERVAFRGDLAVKEPPGWSGADQGDTGVPFRFGAPETRLVFPAELLALPLPGTDPINHHRMVALCEKLPVDVEPMLARQVIAFIESEQNFDLPTRAVARALGYSERSFRRELAKTGTSYRKLAEQVRENRAREMLANTGRPINAIAHDLGYEAASNFARSFKRWTGATPKAFRAAHQTPPGSGQN